MKHETNEIFFYFAQSAVFKYDSYFIMLFYEDSNIELLLQVKLEVKID